LLHREKWEKIEALTIIIHMIRKDIKIDKEITGRHRKREINYYYLSSLTTEVIHRNIYEESVKI
jgi:hypothetical protein